MTFTLNCMAAELARALAVANQVTDHGVKVPVLKSTMISVGPNGAEFAATNTDHSIRVLIAAEGEGEVFVETALLTQKANALRQDQPVSITGDGKFLTIVQRKTRYKVPVLLGAGFPVAFTQAIKGDAVEIPAEPFFAALQAVASTIVPDNSHVIGSGVFLDMADGRFRIIGAQKKGMAVIEIAAPVLPNNLILPLDTIRAMASIFRDSGLLDIVVDKDGISATDDGVMYRSKLIEGQYPDWSRIGAVHVNKVNRSVTFDADEFNAAVARATAIAEDRQKDDTVTAMRLRIGGGECEILARNRSGEEGVDVCAVDGEDTGTLGLAIAKTINVLDTMKSKRLRLQFVDDMVAGMVLSADPPGELEDYRVMMPMLVAHE